MPMPQLPPRCHSADKVEEAKFFFTLLKERRGKMPDETYLLRAVATSCHSVVDLLKADFRGRADFPKWFNQQKSRIETTRFGRWLTKFRNDSVHNGVNAAIEFVCTHEKGSLTFNLERDGTLNPKLLLEISAPPGWDHGPCREEVAEAMESVIDEVLAWLPHSASRAHVSPAPGAPAATIDDHLASIDEHIGILEQIVNDGVSKFGISRSA
jgi:hypothetical protein